MTNQLPEAGLAGKVALITGSSKGIGAAVAIRLARAGCNLVLVARSADALDELRTTIFEIASVSIEIVQADLATATARGTLFRDHRDIDILINNAGSISGGSLVDIDETRWREGWELKVFGYIDLTRRYYGHMAERGNGVIVNVIGAAGQIPDARYICGSVGNSALMMLTMALGGISLDRGVRVTGVNPGLVETDRMVSLLKTKAADVLGDGERWREMSEHLPGGRAARPEEIASAVAFLASPDASYISGTILTVDGGFSSRGRSF